MNIVIYASPRSGRCEKSQQCLDALGQIANVETCQAIDTLSAKLRRTRYGRAIAIIFASSREELLEIQALGDLLCKARLILILSDLENSMVKIGHSLFPRFLTCADKSPQEVVAVVERMVKQQSAFHFN